MRDINTIKLMWKQLMYILDKKQKRNMVVIFFVILLGAALETLGVSVMLPFMQMLTTPQKLMGKGYIRFFADMFGIRDAAGVTGMTCAAMVLVYVIKNIGLTISGYLQTRYSTQIIRQISCQTMYSYMHRPYQFFVDTSSGEIIRGVSGDAVTIRQVIINMFKFLSEALVVVLVGIYVIMADPLMAFGIIIICSVCFLGIVYVLKNQMSKLGFLAREADSETNKAAIQIVYGIKDIFVRQKRDMFLEAYGRAVEKSCRANTGYTFACLLPERIIETMCISGIIIVVMIRIVMGVNTEEFIPMLAVLAVAAFRILPSISRITGYASGFIFQRPALAAAYENIKASREYMASLELTSRDMELGNEGVSFNSSIEVNKLAWAYDEKSKNVLDGVDLAVKKGETVGIVGESGAGKSTLCDILLGLYRPQKGTVSVDGYNISDIPYSWSKMMGYVPQMVYLLDDTIRNNVAFGEKSIDDDDVWRALEQASLKSFVMGLPEGLDTITGERGIKLSGGQRQRVAIARALYNKPDILILDEATSALDNETEASVIEAIEQLKGSVTMIIIAHRFTTIRKCDRIMKIENGKIIEISRDEIF